MKLAQKLTIAFLLVSLIAVGLAAALIWGRISYEFSRYLESQRQNEFVTAVTAYYQEHLSWTRVDDYLRQQQLLPPMGEVNPPPQPYVLVGPRREVIVAAVPYLDGEKVRQGEIDKGIPIEFNGQVVGTVISTGQPLVRKPIEQKYIDQINQAFWLAGVVGALVALVFGIFLARSLTRPVRELTDATRAMAQGQLGQQVPVRTQDELGELAQSFNQMSADLTRATQARRQMTADIAHDLRNPLTVIGGYLESLQDGKLQPTPERFATMQAEVRHLQGLVEDLRTLSLADAGELKLHIQSINPGELLAHVAASYRHQAAQQKVEIKVKAEPELPKIQVDPERMEQVLGNLVSNALRYTPEGGEVSLVAEQAEGSMIVSVQDNGTGIPPDILPHIFERSYRGDPARSGNESGLGLAIVKSIVELHGGSVSATSQPGVGSCFSLTLPN
jgi:signal transduction histidine kinase